MRVIVIGAGGVGRHVAAALAGRGAQICLLEREPAVAEQAAQALAGVTVLAMDGASPAGLRAAQAGEADALIAATGSDPSNLIAAALARTEFGVPRVIACLRDPAQA